jgi:hypothetical protein
LRRRIGHKPPVVYPVCLSFKGWRHFLKTSRIGYAGWPAFAINEQRPV